MTTRLALDLGTNSIGWALVSLKNDGSPDRIIDTGVMAFPDGRNPKSKEPTALRRRTMRQARVQRKRRKGRENQVIHTLVKNGFLPQDKSKRILEQGNPYELRARALDEELSLHDLARSLYHLSKRRGPRLSRDLDADDQEETGLVRAGVLAYQQRSSEFRTCGEFLYHELSSGRTVRSRADIDYRFPREAIEEEFDAIWDAQSRFNPRLTDKARREIREAIFFQRPLKRPKRGPCTFNEDDERLPKALPKAQEFVIRQEVNNIRVIQQSEERRLTAEEREVLVDRLAREQHLTFANIKRVLQLHRNTKINLEGISRDRLGGNQTSFKLSSEGLFGDSWWQLPEDRQEAVVRLLIDEMDEATVLKQLFDDFDLSQEAAQRVSDAVLPKGTINLGVRAVDDIMPHLRQGLGYAEACAAAGYHHSDFKPLEHFKVLPKYTDLQAFRRLLGGRETISNPTVNIVLGQLRKLFNAIVKEYGSPDEIAVETTRDLCNSFKAKKAKQHKDKDNQKTRKYLAENYPDKEPTYENRMRLRLWLEMPEDARVCVYSGTPITNPFDSRLEVDHIIPYSLSFDDSIANQVLVIRMANQAKGKNDPRSAFQGDHPAYPYDEILTRVRHNAHKSPKSSWPKKKKRFLQEVGDKTEFAASQLVDTAYAARLAILYLQHAEGVRTVYGVPGSFTAKLRRQWKIDAVLKDVWVDETCLWKVLGIGDKISGAPLYQGGGSHDIRRDISKELVETAQLIYVDPLGRAHPTGPARYPKPAAPGQWGRIPIKEKIPVSYRCATQELTFNKINSIKNPKLRGQLLDFLKVFVRRHHPSVPEAEWRTALSKERDRKEALRAFQEKTGTRHIRLVTEHSRVVPIHNKEGRLLGSYYAESFHHLDIVEDADGKTQFIRCTYPELQHHRCEDHGHVKLRLFQGSILRLTETLTVNPRDAKLGKRADHRHHALDALVVSCVSRSLLLNAHKAHKKGRLGRSIEEYPLPWEGFQDSVREALGRIIVVHKEDHGTEERLFHETCLSIDYDFLGQAAE